MSDDEPVALAELGDNLLRFSPFISRNISSFQEKMLPKQWRNATFAAFW